MPQLPDPTSIVIRPGLPVALRLFIKSRTAPDRDATAVDLAQYTAQPVRLIARSDDRDAIGYQATPELTLTAAVLSQSGSLRGHVQLVATGAQTAVLGAAGIERLYGDLILTDQNGVGAVWATIVAAVAPTASAAPASASVVSGFETIPVYLRSLPVTNTFSDPVTIDATATSTTTVYTATLSSDVLGGVLFKLTTATSVSAPPTVRIETGDAAVIVPETQLVGLTTADHSQFIAFAGVTPVLSAGETIRVVVTTAATATAYTMAVYTQRLEVS